MTATGGSKATSWAGADEHMRKQPGLADPASAARAMHAGADGDAADPHPPAPLWPPARVAAVEALWGQGFVTPGGGPETLRLVKPLGLSASATLMLVGGGLGGPAQTVCQTFGAWIASFEADPELCAIAAARRALIDPGNRIDIAGWDRARPAFRRKSANHALSLEAIRGGSPDALLESMAAALRPHGHIVLTELVSDDAPDGQDAEFAAWCRLENRPPQLPKPTEVTGALKRLHFDVRVIEDLSDRHISQTLGGWRSAVRGMAAGPRPTPQAASAFVTEAELWLLRIRLMRRLGVRLIRWHAIGSA
jgi:hypothetical protein